MSERISQFRQPLPGVVARQRFAEQPRGVFAVGIEPRVAALRVRGNGEDRDGEAE